MHTLGILFFVALLLSGCASVDEPPESACTFTNPIAPGADPWVIRHDGWYYFAESRGDGIYVSKTDDLTDLKRNAERVWAPPETGWNRTHIWAPELHFLDGRWYIYYTAGEDGPPFIHQRSGVLESATDDPQGEYEDRGRLYTGDGDADEGENIWAIDLTVGRIGEQLYAVWSGWEENQSTDRTPQHLYIAEMSDPLTIEGERVKISSPEESWERGTELDLNEGPQFLMMDEEVFIIYSTHESWLVDYRLGQLRLASPDADPLDPESWIKSGPVFMGTESVHGVGHASFTTSPDGSEDWIVYHSKTDTEPGWDRALRMQSFEWSDDGAPDFGTPVSSSEDLPMPSGQCD